MSKISIALLIWLSLIALASTKPHNGGRIVGGSTAVVGSFPYQVSLRFNGSHICGATIISRRCILSAAHCVGDEDEQGNYFVYAASYFTVRVGSNERLRGGVIVSVSSIFVNENYSNFLHDLSVLYLKTRLIYSDNIQPIPLASAEAPTGGQVTISGWGSLATYGDTPSKLQWNTAKTLSTVSCFSKIGRYSSALLCLDHSEGNGACFGDSGGPATYDGELVGVASFVVNSCGSTSPDGYANVFNHIDWIKKNSDV